MGQLFHFLQVPTVSSLDASSPPSFTLDLMTIKQITDPLGIPWHPLSKKGHDFQSSFSYIGLEWDIDSKTVTISSEKHLCLISKLTTLLSVPHLCVNKKNMASIHGSLQQHESCCSSSIQLSLPHQFELCSTTRQMRENKVMDVNEALTFTVIDSRNTELCQHNRQIGMHSHLATNTTACTSHTNHIPWSSHSPYWTLAPNIIKESSGHSPPPST